MTSANGQAAFREATAANPCPRCSKSDYCRVSDDGDVCLCRRVSAGGEERTYADGSTYYLHRLGASTNGHSSPAPRFTQADGQGQRADPDTLHKVYSALLDALPLDEHHQDKLRARGLKGDLKAAGYRTLRQRGRFRAVQALIAAGLEELLPQAPGFCVKEGDHGPYWTVGGAVGTVIPIRDVEGRIVALQVRADFAEGKQSRYSFVSSKKRGGAGPGAPVHVPLFDGGKATVRVTEGGLKADVATALSGVLTVGLAGVHGRQRAAAVLRRLKAKTARVAFDADARRNPHVAEALRQLVRQLRAEGFTVELETWQEVDGKGIDDLLAAGKVPELVTGDAVLVAVEEIVAAARATSPAPPEASTEGTGPGVAVAGEVVEAADDCHRLAGLFLADHTTKDGRAIHYWREEWHEWSGSAYRIVPDKEVQAHLCKRTKEEFDRLNRIAVQEWRDAGGVSHKGKPAPKPCARNVTSRLTSDVRHALASLALLPSALESPAWLGEPESPAPFPAAEVLACRNALVHLPGIADGANCLVAPTPRFFSANALDYDFDPRAPQPAAWLEFLRQLWPDDPEAVATLQEWFGYCLLPDTSQQKILMIVGPKRSGKGTIARVLRRVVGVRNTAGPSLASLATNFGLWPLLDKTVAVISDARLSGRSDAAVIVERLLNISGEDAQTIDRKNMQPVPAKLAVRFAILTNELPKLNDPSGALVGRLVLLRQTRSWYGSEDTRLTDRLLRELPGVLLWACEGWRRLRERGRFLQPDSGVKLVREMEDLSSPVGAFIREHCVVGAGLEAPVKGMFERWRRWCESVGREKPGTEQTFGRDLRAAIPTLDDRRPRGADGDRQRVYVGIGLRAEECGIPD